MCTEVGNHVSGFMCVRSWSRTTDFCPPSLPNQRVVLNKTRQRKLEGMDGEIGGIESLLEGFIGGLRGDQMLRDKPSDQPGWKPRSGRRKV